MSAEFDLIVIGAGPGGHAAAEEAARLGARVAVVERDKWGGTCTHLGCIPTKALLACSRKYAEIGKLRRFGTLVSGVACDFAAMKRHQEQIVRVAEGGIRKSLDDAGVQRLEGEGTILSPSEVEVIKTGEEKLRVKTKRILIAWGSEPVSIPGVRLSNRILNSNGFLAMEKLPSRIVIVGGGAIGVEFANLLAELGVRVTLIELMEQILPFEDKEAADFLARELTGMGVEIHTSSRMLSLEETGEGVRFMGEEQGKEILAEAECALISAGRKPLLHKNELDRLAISYSDKNGIAVNGHQMTSIENIFALGDVTGGMLFAHRASAQGRALANHLFGDGSFFYGERSVPSVVYTHPNLSRVGLIEKEARNLGLNIEIKKTEYGANMTARTELRGNGFVKVVLSEGRLCGITIVGDGAVELIAAMGLAMTGEMTIRDLRKWILPHPSLSELLRF